MRDPAKKLARKSLGEEVFDRMHRAIKSGAYAAEERLPAEHDLAAEFQVSRPVIRDALQRLRRQGLIYSRQGAGSFVRQSGMRQPLGFGQVENISDLQKCYEFRLTVEPAAAAAAAERADQQGISQIEMALQLMADATASHRHSENADFAFHLAIANASDNQYFATAMDALEDHIAVGMHFHGASLEASQGGLESVYNEHQKILQAIMDRNAPLAEKLMRAHLEGSRDRLFFGLR